MSKREARKIHISGAVQGVGFRPFVWRIAHEEGVTGEVANTAEGVIISVEGDSAQVDRFLQRLQQEPPALARIDSIRVEPASLSNVTSFTIVESSGGVANTVILPDIGLCDDCLMELFDPSERRFRYPFITCTNCGPRYSIIEKLPYDRPNTTMKDFPLCPDCAREYADPSDRRFHAQPLACPVCGPQLALLDGDGNVLAEKDDALIQTILAIQDGKIVAVKGIGGFQLMVNALNEDAVKRLRLRKQREEKPFAVMMSNGGQVCDYVEADASAFAVMSGPEAPILLCRKRTDPLARQLPDAIAPGNPNLGVMLPYSPLHYLLMGSLGIPVVATSGNLSDEPICIDEQEALERLHGIADLFLVHNRPIARHVDDSVVRLVNDEVQVLRRARGYAPMPVRFEQPLPHILAVGAHFKNTVALSVGQNVFLSQHIGDLETVEAHRAFRESVESLRGLYDHPLDAVACDLHPDYLSTQYAKSLDVPVIPVQHHEAHVVSCLAENHLTGPAVGIAWDGLGLGHDRTIWGGEFFRVDEDYSCERVASLIPFPLPGGDKANREPRRAALGVLYTLLGEDIFQRNDLASVTAFAEHELTMLKEMLSRGTNCPVTSSMGRLFDVVASLLDLRQILTFEGQAAMQLEYLLHGDIPDSKPYSFQWVESDQDVTRLDWRPMVRQILDNIGNGIACEIISRRFHDTLVDIILDATIRFGEKRVAMSGGCFQNRYLLEQAIKRMTENGFEPVWHRELPPNDGGIALGQVMIAGRILKQREE